MLMMATNTVLINQIISGYESICMSYSIEMNLIRKHKASNYAFEIASNHLRQILTHFGNTLFCKTQSNKQQTTMRTNRVQEDGFWLCFCVHPADSSF